MLILSNAPKVLLQVPLAQWREPSQAQAKDQFGRQNQTRFRLDLWKRDGGLVDSQCFDDRDEFDHALWRVVNEPYADIVPMWFAVQTLTASPGSLQSYSVGYDWNNADNMLECIGGGASGGAAWNSGANRSASGGSGGGYGQYVNLSLTPGGSA
ncbi:MAG: hypothetical protein K0Q69_2921, partial [Devosia sp.]|nr:hypothetical protein [Devosia sp.]